MAPENMGGLIMTDLTGRPCLAQADLDLCQAYSAPPQAWVCLAAWTHPVVRLKDSVHNLLLEQVVDVMDGSGKAELPLLSMALPRAHGPAWIQT